MGGARASPPAPAQSLTRTRTAGAAGAHAHPRVTALQLRVPKSAGVREVNGALSRQGRVEWGHNVDSVPPPWG